MDWAVRYTTPLSDVFSAENKVKLQVRVELALLQALAEHGLAPSAAHEALAKEADKVTLQRVQEIESQTHHDVMAMVHALAERSSEFGGYVHLGATSQDINDCVLALQLQQAKAMLTTSCRDVRRELTRLARQHKTQVCIGRTHGQHAIPTTFGFKLANHLYEVAVAEAMLQRAAVDIGKFGGAVGTFASLGTRAVGDRVLDLLGLRAAAITTQVLSRLHVADFVFGVAAIAAALERLAKEIRNLQRSEISEAGEGFAASQVGSSTMPQKRNPHKSERVCGIARIIRAQLPPALETVSLEHERDLTNSSVERISVTSAAVLLHYILLQTRGILEKLAIDQAAMQRNLLAPKGRQLSERIMMALASKGVSRQAAHEMLRVHSAHDDFLLRVRQDALVTDHLTAGELDNLLDPTTYIGDAVAVVEQVIRTHGVV